MVLQSITTGYVVDDTVLVRNSEPLALVFGSAEQDHEQCAGQIDPDVGGYQFRGRVNDCTTLSIGQLKAHVPVLCTKRHRQGEVLNPKKCSVGVGVNTIESR